jgi:hypothetical protein
MSRGCNNETSIPALRCDVVINSKHTRYIQPKSQKVTLYHAQKLVSLAVASFQRRLLVEEQKQQNLTHH